MNRTLVIGNRNYSSWSLRPWLVLAVGNVPFDEERITLNRPHTKAYILRHSPSGKVPCLIERDGDAVETIWYSLAIAETVNERHLGGRLWPSDARRRAHARAVAAEMHSGFAALRTHLPMDIRGRYQAAGAVAQQRADVAADIARVHALWTDCLQRSGGPFLLGDFSIDDAFYAPVVTRFRTWGVALTPPLAAYSAALFALPAMQRWVAAAEAETETLNDG